MTHICEGYAKLHSLTAARQFPDIVNEDKHQTGNLWRQGGNTMPPAPK